MNRFDEVAVRQVTAAQFSLQKMQKAWGPGHSKLIAPLQNLADLQFALQQYAEAEQNCLRILSIATKNFGQDHGAVAAALQMIGEVCEVQDLYVEAERFYLWSFEILEKTKTDDDQLTNILSRLAHLYRTMRQPFKARIIEMRLVRALTSKDRRAAKAAV